MVRIQEEMDRLIATLGFDGNRAAFVEHLRTDPGFYYSTGEELVEGYRSLKARVEERVPTLFARMPSAAYEIRPVEPFRERFAARGSLGSGARRLSARCFLCKHLRYRESAEMEYGSALSA
jgi:uncharacterized protein (DUF885 family)